MRRSASMGGGEDELLEDDEVVGAMARDEDRIFNDNLTDPDLIGRQVVKKALTLIECSRHGLQEGELLELLAPRGKRMLPPLVWARLYRSLELYLHPLGEEENGMLGFFSQQMVHAVRKRYLQNNRLREAEVCSRLADYFMAKADPSRDGMYQGEGLRYFEDLVYYHIRALRIDSIKGILGSLIFIERRARRGAGQMERLLRDYHMTQEEIRGLKLSVLKAMMSRSEFNKFSRAALLSWLGEYMVFVGSHHTQLTSYPSLAFQYALNQPDISGPHIEAVNLLQKAQATIIERMDTRERRACNRVEAAIWAMLCLRYHAVLSPASLPTSPGRASAVPAPGSTALHISATAARSSAHAASGLGSTWAAASPTASPFPTAAAAAAGRASSLSSTMGSSMRTSGGAAQLLAASGSSAALMPRGGGVAAAETQPPLPVGGSSTEASLLN
ncbi:hypothetical protein EON68_02800, partial [archaeon]